MARYGVTIPLDDGVPLHAQGADISRLADLGYTDVWSTEVDGADAFTPLTLASVWAPTLRLGTAIVPAYTRGPATLAQSVASLADAAPGRFAFGVGSSSDVIVQRWNGIPFEQPYQRVRDTVRFLREALTGAKVVHDYETFSVNGFRLRHPPKEQPQLLVAALREGMLRLAGREADGVIINWLSAADVATVVPVVRDAADGEAREVVARIFVAPSTSVDQTSV
jgi:probable F420-dependent oxidoreductase